VGGSLPYLVAVVQGIWAFRPRRLRLVLDGGEVILERRAIGLAVAIGPAYGGGLRIAPRAVIDDGLLDVCLVGDLRPLQLLALLPRCFRGTHDRHPKVELFRCRELSVDAAAADRTGCQADGELVGELPARFWIEPGGLRCVVGRRR
jgi:diacylglycerol kinase (ATP)